MFSKKMFFGENMIIRIVLRIQNKHNLFRTLKYQRNVTTTARELQNVAARPETNKNATAALIKLQPYKLHKLDKPPNTTVELTRSDGLQIYKNMVAIKTMTDAIKTINKTGMIRGWCHLSTGREASTVGMAESITDDDAVITAYRTHGWAYLRHISFHGILSELTGRATGVSRSKGGSQHIYSRKFNFYGGQSIVGSQVPIGAGIALALKYQQKQNICLALYGDGAANQGQVFEAFNMAKLWDLPCIFVCENDGFAKNTPISRAAANTNFYTRGDYIPGVLVDGMDVLAVREVTRFAKEYALQNGPIVLEVVTSRSDGHSVKDADTKSVDEEIGQNGMLQKCDPIHLLKQRILDHSLAEDIELEEIKIDIKEAVQEAAVKALNDTEVPLEELYSDVYVDQSNLNLSIRGCDYSTGSP